jgi:hypothetical protein
MAPLDVEVDAEVRDAREVVAGVELLVAQELLVQRGGEEALRQAAGVRGGHERRARHRLQHARDRHHHRVIRGDDEIRAAELDGLAQHRVSIERECAHVLQPFLGRHAGKGKAWRPSKRASAPEYESARVILRVGP